MNGTIDVALGVVFLALATPFFRRAKTAPAEKARSSRLAGMMFTLAGAGFLVAAAISFIAAE